MPNWYFSKEGMLRTPSRLDGIDYMTEIRYRREGTRFIMNCGNRMRLYPYILFSKMYSSEFSRKIFLRFSRWIPCHIDYFLWSLPCTYKCTCCVKFSNHFNFYILPLFHTVVTDIKQVKVIKKKGLFWDFPTLQQSSCVVKWKYFACLFALVISG